VPGDVETLRSAYRAFNARDIEGAIQLMHPEVDWPNAWEGGRVVGRAALRNYWNRQFAAISSKVEPEGFTDERMGASPSTSIRWSTTRAPASCSSIRAFATATGSRMAS
jgi:SnoaL-like domain